MDKELIEALGKLLDERLNNRLTALFDEKLDSKLNTILDSKLEPIKNELSKNSMLLENLNQKVETMAENWAEIVELKAVK